MDTSRPGSTKGIGRSRTAFTTLKMAVLAPIPRTSASSATALNPGLLQRTRVAKRRSFQRLSIIGAMVQVPCQLQLPVSQSVTGGTCSVVGRVRTETHRKTYFRFSFLVRCRRLRPPPTRNEKRETALGTSIRNPTVVNIDNPVAVLRVFLVVGYLDNRGAAVI